MVKIGIIGATGNVGKQVVQQLLQHGVPAHALVLMASEASLGRVVAFKDPKDSYKEYAFVVHSSVTPPECAVYILATEAHISRSLFAILPKESVILDSSSALRMDPQVPLLSPLMNGHLISQDTNVYAHANCVASPCSLALAPLRPWGIEEVVLSSYQSASGAGWGAMQELLAASTDHIKGNPVALPTCYPRNSAFNAFPEIGALRMDGHSEEEVKIVHEIQKILELSVPIYVTAVRVPTLRGHAVSAWVRLRDDISLDEVLDVFHNAPGLRVSGTQGYHSPQEVMGSDLVFIGRIRMPAARRLQFWACSDNLRRGAATDLVESTMRVMSLRFLKHFQP
jgi:aspartate-semialdehyde dehydrogenase